MLEELNEEIRACRKCRLGTLRRNAVPGDGSETADIMFVGEGPGGQEDIQGRPFVGPAGQFLNELLGRIGLRREEVFITNVVKCRPPQNRDPLPGEIDACNEYLMTQIAIIKPKVICTLGRFAMGVLIEEGLSISRVHGNPYRKSGILYVPLYHPAAALHQEALRQVQIQDIEKLGQLLAEQGSDSN